MFEKLLRLFFGRVQVRHPKTVPLLIEKIRADLKERGFPRPERISDPVAVAIIHEAARRAAEEEKDGSLRSGRLIDQCEVAVESIMKVASGDRDADPRIRVILEFHHVL